MSRIMRSGLTATARWTLTAAIGVASPSAYSQAAIGAGPLPAFDHAIVLPGHPATGPIVSVAPDTGEFTAEGVTLKNLISYAYDVEPSRVSGGPKWIYSARYQVKAWPPKHEHSPLPQSEVKRLVRGLLFDYFGLKAHKGHSPLYVLGQAPAGSSLRLSGKPPSTQRLMDDGHGHLQGRAIRISQLTGALEHYLSHPVLDETRLDDVYDLNLHWDADAAGAGALVTALRRQLGLSLRSIPVEVLVIDSVGKQPAYKPRGHLFELAPSGK